MCAHAQVTLRPCTGTVAPTHRSILKRLQSSVRPVKASAKIRRLIFDLSWTEQSTPGQRETISRLSEASGEYSTTYPLLLCHGKYSPVCGKGIEESDHELLRYTPGTTRYQTGLHPYCPGHHRSSQAQGGERSCGGLLRRAIPVYGRERRRHPSGGMV